MTSLRGEELLADAERLVAMAIAHGAEQAEAYWQWGSSLSVELQSGRIHSTETGVRSGAGLRVVHDGRLGFAYCTQMSEAERAVEQALAAARLAPPKRFTLPGRAEPVRLQGRWDSSVAALDVDRTLQMARELLDGAAEGCPSGTVSGGGVAVGAEVVAIANSSGLALHDASTLAEASASVVVEEGERAVSGGDDGASHTARLDAGLVGRTAGETTAALRKARPLEAAGRMDVVLRPHAALELAGALTVSAANGDDAMRGRSVWTGKRGEAVAHARLSVRDDVLADGAVGATPFDGEGRPTGTLPILEGSVLRHYLFDTWDALQHGQQPTGSAVRGSFKARPDTGTHHLVLEDTQARPLERLLDGIPRGLLVDQVLGAHTANATTGEFSVTSPGLWLIEDGQVGPALQQVAIAGSLTELMASFAGGSREAKAMPGARVPHLWFHDVAVSL